MVVVVGAVVVVVVASVVVVVGVVVVVVGAVVVTGGRVVVVVGRVVVGVGPGVVTGVVGDDVVGEDVVGDGGVVAGGLERRSLADVVVVSATEVVVDSTVTCCARGPLVEVDVDEPGVCWPAKDGSRPSVAEGPPRPSTNSAILGKAAAAPNTRPRMMHATPSARRTPVPGSRRRKRRLGGVERNCSASRLASDSGSSLSPLSDIVVDPQCTVGSRRVTSGDTDVNGEKQRGRVIPAPL